MNQIKKNIFIVHNHEDPFAKEVEAFLIKEKFNPIIMEEVTNKLKDIEFSMAIILLTEDLELTEESQSKTNFIFEIGYCYGYLENISSLVIIYDEKIQIPSDIEASEYIKIDENWKNNLSNFSRTRVKKDNLKN